MGASGGPKILDSSLVFGYDTGYPLVSSNTSTYKFNKGEPTENHIPNIGTSVANWSEYGWSGDFVTSSDFPNTFELTSTNGWHNATFDHGQSSGTVNISFDYKLKSRETSGIWGFILNGTHLGSYTSWLTSLNTTNNNLPSFEWQTLNTSYTAGSDTKLAIGLRGTDNGGLSDTLYIKNLQVEVNSHRTPFVNGTRSNTGAIIDLKRQINLNVSNISFDSNAQPTFDGTDDYLEVPSFFVPTGSRTVEVVVNIDTVDNGSNQKHIFANSDQPGNGTDDKGIAILYRNGHLRGYVWEWNGSTSPRLDKVFVTNAEANKYYHLVITHDDITAKFYCNGELITSGSCEGSRFPSNDTTIGRYGPGYSLGFNGDIPIVRVYSKVLSDEEIANNFRVIENRFGL